MIETKIAKCEYCHENKLCCVDDGILWCASCLKSCIDFHKKNSKKRVGEIFDAWNGLGMSHIVALWEMNGDVVDTYLLTKEIKSEVRRIKHEDKQIMSDARRALHFVR